MKTFINKLIINGAKNIDKPIELLFTNKTVKDDISLTNSNVKAIYGPNGSGKSGIISALYIYKRLIDDVDGINDKLFSKFIYETINKDLKKLLIDVVFTILTDGTSNCYKHTIELSANNDETITISKEEIYILKGKSIKNENFSAIAIIENGTINYLKAEKNCNLYENPIYVNSLNLLDKHSITNTIFKLVKTNQYKDLGDYKLTNALLSIIILAINTTVILNKEDMHLDYISNRLNEMLYDEEKINKILGQIANDFSIKNYLINLSEKDKDVVSIKSFDAYKENLKMLEQFIKIFKNDLDEIIIDKKINNDKLYCEKIFKYGNKLISVEFESTGIKKLVRLYSAFRSCANGGISFIDEMDANLHDVYFMRLVEFFKNDAKGQLCFTTHNLEPINILKGNAHSLDFISNDSRVYSWTKDGNKSPVNKYVNGLIPYSPFNVESIDFDVLLDDEE